MAKIHIELDDSLPGDRSLLALLLAQALQPGAEAAPAAPEPLAAAAPPAPPAPTAPTPPIATEDNPETGSDELDSAGVAWSADLHASTRTKNKDGTWKAKPNRGGTAAAPEAPPAAPTAPAAPAAPAPAASSARTMADIYGLMRTNQQKITVNEILEKVTPLGFSNLSEFAQGSTPEQRGQVYDQLQALI